ncbi:hypothetical protein B0T19DRAFT_464325 [Cercophora scortea]|uniref:NACHT domain-containing protein n=1 Tax=Cercophora scortea TaxID=314031 RepID=A0AAE0IGL0_9PEZI|nr:hypothetical protein B0T19DRAFT_464325 [Cercophora scortea]
MAIMESMMLSASRAKPEVRLGHALSAFEDSLSDERKASFRAYRAQAAGTPPSLEDVRRVVAEFDQRTGKPFGGRFVNVLKAVQQFSAFGDVIVGGAGNIVPSAVWGDKVSELFMDIGQTAPRHKELALLYATSRRLQCDLLEYFIVMVQLCQKLFHRSLFSQVKAHFKLAIVDPELKSCKEQLDKWAASIDHEVALLISQTVESEAREQSRFRALWANVAETESRRKKLKARQTWLDLCSEYDYEKDRKRIRKQGNTTFFLRDPAYVDWKNHAGSSTLMCRGMLGAGKSVLMANMVDDLVLTRPQPNAYAIAYFFISDHAESIKARTVLGCIVRQILEVTPTSDWTEVLSHRAGRVLNEDDLVEVLRKVFPRGQKVFVVLDGLDQCSRKERIVLMDRLRDLRASFQLSVCGSLRVEANMQPQTDLGRLKPDYVLQIPAIHPEIGGFVEAELQSLLQSGELVVGDLNIVEEIRACLVEGAAGMFLWVSLQLQTICLEMNDAAIRQALRDIPRDLPATFDHILSKSRCMAPEYQSVVLKMLACAFRPLTTDEIRAALSIAVGSTIWTEDRMINDVNKTLACCGSLVVVDEEELTVHLVHSSARQFLLGEMKPDLDSNSNSSSLQQWQFSIQDAHRQMTGTTATYLSIFNTSKQLALHDEASSRTPKAEQPALVPHPNHTLGVVSKSGAMPKHLIKAITKMHGIKSRLAKATVDIRNTVDNIEISPSTSSDPSSNQARLFLPYAKTHWLAHSVPISNSDSQDNQVFLLWKGLVLQPDFDQDIDLSDTTLPPPHPSESTAVPWKKLPRGLLWAILHSHHSLMDLLLSKRKHRLKSLNACLKILSALPHEPALDRAMVTRLLTASLLLRGHSLTTNRLLGMNLDIRYGRYGALYAAILSNNRPATQQLLAQIDRSPRDGGPSALRGIPLPLVEAAVNYGDGRTVYWLARHGADVNFHRVAPPLATALARMVHNPGVYVWISYVLLRAGADVGACEPRLLWPALRMLRKHVDVTFFDPAAYIAPLSRDLSTGVAVFVIAMVIWGTFGHSVVDAVLLWLFLWYGSSWFGTLVSGADPRHRAKGGRREVGAVGGR